MPRYKQIPRPAICQRVFAGLAPMVLMSGLLTGCSPQPTAEPAAVVKPPLPVTTMVLRRGRPDIQRHTTGSIAPWKTEQIGFEQAGRVEFVIEPNVMVRPSAVDEPSPGGTPLARLDDERLRIAVESATADVSVARLRRDANRIAIDERLPAAITVAKAERDLADTERARAEKLDQQNAISSSELDNARTRANTAQAQLASAEADLLQAKAEQLTFEAQVAKAEHELAEAERNLQNSVLTSSFPGIVSEIHAVPGSYVDAGEPVVSVQMVDPMLVEFEVTAKNSRRYHAGDSLQVIVGDDPENLRKIDGLVYTVDTTADARSRTFTITLHVRNEVQEVVLPESLDGAPLAYTRNIFPLNLGPIITGDDRQLVERSTIHQIGDQAYVYRITNRKWGMSTVAEDRTLDVERVPVKVTGEPIPFLGAWNFVTVEFDSSAEIDFQQDLITGELYLPRSASDQDDAAALPASNVGQSPVPEDWNGTQVILDKPRWLLRAGDVVRVGLLPEKMSEGFYVPMKAVRKEKEQTFVHVIDESQSPPRAHRVPVSVAVREAVTGDSVMLRITPTQPGNLSEGIQVVVGGTHYLDDGDRVRITPALGAAR
ncbi:HlyD family secretion protein [Roseimaritima ulvae]|uniref:Inner membrane protein YiaV n=1 Tax=Roseimaritima ulvae TaxID=980254 RepID=A0A5B9QVC3_9BACT|nr:HlyD family secretion protein [Roseimaritima ulvae]QEG41036.1 Inner membrane protein YiaV precursor [Roseimaritima ulvae]